MAGELLRLATVEQVWVALAEQGGSRFRHLTGAEPPPPEEAGSRAMAGQTIVQEIDDAGVLGHGWAVAPILVGERALGVLGLALRRRLPLDAWSEHVLWAASDLMALLLIGRRPEREGRPGTGELRLTRRQRDVVFELVERAASNDEIAERLGLSARTVKIHLQAAYRRLGVRSRAEAISLVLTRHADWLALERERRQDRPRP